MMNFTFNESPCERFFRYVDLETVTLQERDCRLVQHRDEFQGSVRRLTRQSIEHFGLGLQYFSTAFN